MTTSKSNRKNNNEIFVIKRMWEKGKKNINLAKAECQLINELTIISLNDLSLALFPIHCY